MLATIPLVLARTKLSKERKDKNHNLTHMAAAVGDAFSVRSGALPGDQDFLCLYLDHLGNNSIDFQSFEHEINLTLKRLKLSAAENEFHDKTAN